MSVASTCRFVLLLVVWLCPVTTTLSASAGYYMIPFLQQNHYFRLRLNPQRTPSALVLSGHNTVVVQDKPVSDNQGHLLARKTPVVVNQGDVITWDESVVDNEPDVKTRDDSVVLSRSQDIDDPSAQLQLKCALNPCRRTKELTVRGGDSDIFIGARDLPEGAPSVKLFSGRSSFPAGKRADDVRGSTTTKPRPSVEDPSLCVWAIVSCCSPGSKKIRHPCFELLGCPGPFWDTNPCSRGMTASAVKVVHQFYSSGTRD